jgi:hypothetical protein
MTLFSVCAIGENPMVGQCRQPLSSSHLATLTSQSPYLLTWSPDGITCVTYITRDGVYLAPRLSSSPFAIYHVPNLYFPHRKLPAERVDKYAIFIHSSRVN